ncbi:serine protease [Streptomyces sp. TRM72054]|uniref:VMAP-C domain-containing protein n=1 Tax=Streptomyces sp. TRM72054 TaxID=2870562 RepID=UPI001C8C7CE8|nr:trypsin-like peptidase domain-containing protein [Streptomyces sp. TRM72054]MBX9392513.1 serine protease [Streptomyces sp. TRM72054]
MRSQSWQVQVRAGGIGSGFLVTNRHVMTCAHVVDGAERAEVRFAQYPDLGPLEATVIVGGDWTGADQARGDVAVLELDQPVDIPPARFAAVDAPYEHPTVKLTAYGFPRNYDEGILGEFRSTSDQLIAGEWLQLEAWTGHSRPLEAGFSGAAVVREDTDEVVGMVTAKHSAGGGGRMLPSRSLVRHWAGAAGLVPVPGHRPEVVEKLRDLVQSCADVCVPETVYRSVLERFAPLPPPPPAGGFLSLWDVAWFLLTEVRTVPGAAPCADFATYLAELAPDPATRRNLFTWAGNHRAGTATLGPWTHPVRDGRTKWSPVLVEIERSGVGHDAYLVSVYAILDRRTQLVASKTLARRHVPEYVRGRLDLAFRQIDRSGEELIAFALPRDWLDEPVDEWHTSDDDPTPLGCSAPVVVMDLGRRRQSRLQFKLEKVWQNLDRRSDTAWHRVGCDRPQNPAKLTVKLRGLDRAVGYGAPPDTDQARGLLLAGLNAAVPVMVWPRSGCSGQHKEDTTAEHACAGTRFLDALEEHLASFPAADLPRHVHELRREAFMAEESEPHWAAGLALVWEDPRWFPEADIYPQSPIS